MAMFLHNATWTDRVILTLLVSVAVNHLRLQDGPTMRPQRDNAGHLGVRARRLRETVRRVHHISVMFNSTKQPVRIKVDAVPDLSFVIQLLAVAVIPAR